jgi:hypothetical protein
MLAFITVLENDNELETIKRYIDSEGFVLYGVRLYKVFVRNNKNYIEV